MQLALYPESIPQISASSGDAAAWKGDLLAVGIFEDSLSDKSGTHLVQHTFHLIKHSTAIGQCYAVGQCIYARAGLTTGVIHRGGRSLPGCRAGSSGRTA